MATTRSIAVVTMAVAVLLPMPSEAQLNGDNIKGDVVVPLWFYTADVVKDRNGNSILGDNLDSALFGGALSVVTPKKFLGANYGFMVALPWVNNRVQGAEDFDSNPGAGISDMCIQVSGRLFAKPRQSPLSRRWRERAAGWSSWEMCFGAT